MEPTAQFWKLGWCRIADLLDVEHLEFAQKAIAASRRHGRMYRGDDPVDRGTLNEYAPVAGQVLLRHVSAAVEKIVARPLLPGYSYWRIYEHGDSLPRHVDRGACEISLTLTLAGDPSAADWPIALVDLEGSERSVSLPPGAALLYQGSRVPHWREPLSGREQHRLFLHYVLADGEHAGLAHDPAGRLRPGDALSTPRRHPR